jgi:hypothetical protein
MVWIIGLKYLLLWVPFDVIWLLWLCKNYNVLNDKFFSHAGYLPVLDFALIMVVFTTYGESRHVYEDVCRIGGYGEGYFIQHG